MQNSSDQKVRKIHLCRITVLDCAKLRSAPSASVSLHLLGLCGWLFRHRGRVEFSRTCFLMVYCFLGKDAWCPAEEFPLYPMATYTKVPVCDCVEPTPKPTDAPTANPTGAPTQNPTGAPTQSPTNAPTVQPTGTYCSVYFRMCALDFNYVFEPYDCTLSALTFPSYTSAQRLV